MQVTVRQCDQCGSTVNEVDSESIMGCYVKDGMILNPIDENGPLDFCNIICAGKHAKIIPNNQRG